MRWWCFVVATGLCQYSKTYNAPSRMIMDKVATGQGGVLTIRQVPLITRQSGNLVSRTAMISVMLVSGILHAVNPSVLVAPLVHLDDNIDTMVSTRWYRLVAAMSAHNSSICGLVSLQVITFCFGQHIKLFAIAAMRRVPWHGGDGFQPDSRSRFFNRLPLFKNTFRSIQRRFSTQGSPCVADATQLCSDVSGICRDHVVPILHHRRQATWLHTCEIERATLLKTVSCAVRATSSNYHVPGVV